MPNYHQFEWEDFRVRTRPTGIRRILRLLPYFTGRKVIFRVTIDTISGAPQDLETTVLFFEPNRTNTVRARKISWHGRPVNNTSGDFTSQSIGASGDYRFQMKLDWKGVGTDQRDLITFKAIAQETMIGWTIGILVGIGAVIVGILNLLYRL
jgi:hypothetical protein